jgi:Pentapeptide repeats (8 copies)
MANQQHLDVLKQGVDPWNQWRRAHPEIRPDLSEAHLSGAVLVGTDLRDANLRKADLGGATLSGIAFNNSSLKLANLRKADLGNADLSNADLSGATIITTVALFNTTRVIPEETKSLTSVCLLLDSSLTCSLKFEGYLCSVRNVCKTASRSSP